MTTPSMSPPKTSLSARYLNPMRERKGVVAVVAVGFCVMAVFLWWRAGWPDGFRLVPFLQVVTALAACVALLTALLLREPSPETAKTSSRIAVAASIVFTWSTAGAYAWSQYVRYVAAQVGNAGGDASKDFFLVAGFVGGLLALLRSTRTNSSAIATLRTITNLYEEVKILRSVVQPRGTIFELALTARQQQNPYDLVAIVSEMLAIAMKLPDSGDGVDAVSVWLRDDARGQWFILTGQGISEKTIAELNQPIIATETPRAGIVANMAATETSLVILDRDASKHAWFMVDTAATRTTEGFAAVLIRDREQRPVGAICLTSGLVGAVPGTEAAERRTAFEDVLHVWGAAFTLPVDQWLALTAEGAHDQHEDT